MFNGEQTVVLLKSNVFGAFIPIIRPLIGPVENRTGLVAPPKHSSGAKGQLEFSTEYEID